MLARLLVTGQSRLDLTEILRTKCQDARGSADAVGEGWCFVEFAFGAPAVGFAAFAPECNERATKQGLFGFKVGRGHNILLWEYLLALTLTDTLPNWKTVKILLWKVLLKIPLAKFC